MKNWVSELVWKKSGLQAVTAVRIYGPSPTTHRQESNVVSTIDIGGGNVHNRTRYSLARIPLRWMICECYKTQSGILFEPDKLRGVGLDISSLWPEVKPRPPPSSVEDGMKILTIESAEKKEKRCKDTLRGVGRAQRCAVFCLRPTLLKAGLVAFGDPAHAAGGRKWSPR